MRITLLIILADVFGAKNVMEDVNSLVEEKDDGDEVDERDLVRKGLDLYNEWQEVYQGFPPHRYYLLLFSS